MPNYVLPHPIWLYLNLGYCSFNITERESGLQSTELQINISRQIFYNTNTTNGIKLPHTDDKILAQCYTRHLLIHHCQAAV